MSADTQDRTESRLTCLGFDPLIPVIGFVLLAGMAWLYVTGSGLYSRILTYWISIPYRYPFIDAEAIPRWVRCWREYGLVVYTDASWHACGLAPIIYSPLWLRMGFLPTDPAWDKWLGLGLVSLFLLSLGLLPGPRRPGDRVVAILATFSCLPMFAMERGNVDLVIFLLVIGAGLCLGRTFGYRILGYSLMLTGGLLKFYPLVLLVILLRERLTKLVALTFAATAIVVGCVLVLLDEFRRLTPVPAGAPFHNMWGARNLTTGLPDLLQALSRAVGVSEPATAALFQPRFVSAIAAAILIPSTLVFALRLARGDVLRTSLSQIPDRTYQFLLIGGLLIVGCFFAGQNIGYRGVFLLLILPGMLALYRVQENRRSRAVFGVTIAGILCVLWELTIRHVVADVFGGSYFPVEGSAAIYVVWLIQELAWWWIVAILLAIVFDFAACAPVWTELRLLTGARDAFGLFQRRVDAKLVNVTAKQAK